MSGSVKAPKFKLIEVGTCFAGEEGTDYLVVEDHVKASDVLAGNDGISAQAADKLMGEIIVKALNCYPKLVGALERISELTPSKANAATALDMQRTVKAIADTALSLAKGE